MRRILFLLLAASTMATSCVTATAPSKNATAISNGWGMVVTTVQPGGEPDGIYLRAPAGVRIPDDNSWSFTIKHNGAHDTIQIVHEDCTGEQPLTLESVLPPSSKADPLRLRLSCTMMHGPEGCPWDKERD